jgi:hypothetical protein
MDKVDRAELIRLLERARSSVDAAWLQHPCGCFGQCDECRPLLHVEELLDKLIRRQKLKQRTKSAGRV